MESLMNAKYTPTIKSTTDNMKAQFMNPETITQKDKKLSSQYKTEIPNEIIEEQTKKIPNLVFLGAALVSIAASAALTSTNRKNLGNFVGLWAPTLLCLGIYNKLVKIEDELLKLHK
ncbi:MAG: hypothetical protein ABL930_11525 [Pseudobdellovibrio sp.]